MHISLLHLAWLVIFASADVVQLWAQIEGCGPLSPLAIIEKTGGLFYFRTCHTATLFIQQDNFLLRDVTSENEQSVFLKDGFLSFGYTHKSEKFTFDQNDRLITTQQFWACKSIGQCPRQKSSCKIIAYGDVKPHPSCREAKITLRAVSRRFFFTATPVNDVSELRKPLLVLTDKHGEGFFMAHCAGTPFTLENGMATRLVDSSIIATVGLHDGFFKSDGGQSPMGIEFDTKDFLVTNRKFWACKNFGIAVNPLANSNFIMYGTKPVHHSCIEIKIGAKWLSGNVPGKEVSSGVQWNWADTKAEDEDCRNGDLWSSGMAE